MFRHSLLWLFLAISTTGIGQSAGKWTTLFNGKDFTGWDTYLAVPLDSNGKKMGNQPLGLNNDPQKVFTINKKEKSIRISGQSWGAFFTKAEFENYHLQLKFKWGTAKWAEKRGKPLDSGLLYHSVGEPGKENGGSWMRSQEFQIEENNCGDYWMIGQVRQSIPSVEIKPKLFRYDPNGELRNFGANNISWCQRAEATEKPNGEWNTLDLYCFGDTSVHVVNGKVVMVLYQSRQVINGQEIPLTKGKIQLQSEGGEIFYKEIRVRSIQNLNGILH